MGNNYCSCQDYKSTEFRSEMHIESPQIKYNIHDIKEINLNSNINNISYNEYSSKSELNSNRSKSQEKYKNIKPIEQLSNNNLIQSSLLSRNIDKKGSGVLSLIKEKDQEDEISEIDSIKKKINKYNNKNIKDFCYNKRLINSFSDNYNDINIYKDNSFNNQYINNKEIKDNGSNNIIKDIIYRKDFNKRNKNKNQFIYCKKFNSLNNINNVRYNNFESRSNTTGVVPFMYKKVNITTPKITRSKKKQNTMIYNFED